MNYIQTSILQSLLVAVVSLFVLAACNGNGSGGSDIELCPSWLVGDTMTYQTTETVSGVSTTSTAIWTVTDHSASSVSLTDGTLVAAYTVDSGNYIPFSEGTDTYSSSTPFCPLPGVGASYEYTTWVPSLSGRGGDYIPATMTVTERVAESISLLSGSFSVTKLTMSRIGGGRADSTVTRYFASGIGVVMEVEEIPSTTTTITKEMVTYSYQ